MYAILARTGPRYDLPFIVCDTVRAGFRGVVRFRTPRAARAYARKLLEEKHSRIVWTQVYRMEPV